MCARTWHPPQWHEIGPIWFKTYGYWEYHNKIVRTAPDMYDQPQPSPSTESTLSPTEIETDDEGGNTGLPQTQTPSLQDVSIFSLPAVFTVPLRPSALPILLE
jgi:hypothetical protein